MITHLLFSISALIFMIIFIITYFSYKKNISSIRSKIYVCMIIFALSLTIVEIIEGITYVYNSNIVFSLMCKLHSIVTILFVAALFYYYLVVIVDEKHDSFESLLWDSQNPLSIKNFLTFIFVLTIIFSIVLIKPYPMGLTMFYFYTNETMTYLLVLYAIYILYNFYIVFLKSKRNNFERNDYIILIGTFLLFVGALAFEYIYSEISIYSTIFTLILILIYYFKENEDLLIIGELQKTQINLYNSNYFKLRYLHELISDLESPLNTFSIINKKLENCNVLSDEELNDNLIRLNYISNNLVSIVNNQTTNKFLKYRIDKLVKNIAQIIEPSIEGKPVKIAYNIDPNIPSLLIGDRITIHRIITSLLVNGIDNTEVGKVTLTITGERQKGNVILHIKVSDTGVGIKKEDYGRVFRDFTNNYNENKKGNLALTKKYVDSLDGNISFESNYGSGSIFYVNFIQKIANEVPISQSPMQEESIIVNDCNNKKVLIIDDEDYSSKKLTDILNKYNLVTNCIKSGTSAINSIKDGGEYDLIIINENIKDVDYLKLGKSLKYLKDLVKIPPIIALTALNEDEIDKRSLENVFDEYLPKPISLKKLDKIIKKRCI